MNKPPLLWRSHSPPRMCVVHSLFSSVLPVVLQFCAKGSYWSEQVELTWELYCGPPKAHGCCRTCDCQVFCSQLRRDYHEHNRVSILCHGVQYGVFCFLLAGIAAFFAWLAGNVL